MSTRQKYEEIERKAKTVHYSASWSDTFGLMKDPVNAKAVTAAIRAIQGGAPLLTGYYSKGIGTDKDTLLETQGIMHLHLGRPNTNELLYLVQYPNDVVLLELSDHTHFRTRPIGKQLKAKHHVALSAKEAEIDATWRRSIGAASRSVGRRIIRHAERVEGQVRIVMAEQRRRACDVQASHALDSEIADRRWWTRWRASAVPYAEELTSFSAASFRISAAFACPALSDAVSGIVVDVAVSL